MTTTLDECLSELATETAAELERRCARDGLNYVNERDHLQPCCASAAREIAGSWTPPAEVSTGFRFRSDLWPRLGGVDVALLFAGQKPVAVELKCGSGHNALGPCAWDALKLAFALQIGETSAAYLLAGTTATDWARRHRGAELFETAAVDTLALRARFIKWWRQWEGLEDPTPIKVPSRFITRTICIVPFDVGRLAWELRVAAVSVDSSDQIAWPSTRAPLRRGR